MFSSCSLLVLLPLLLFPLWVIFVRTDFITLFYSLHPHRLQRLDSYFSSRVIWITGASSGIGEELAYQSAKHGARLVLSARREDELKRVAIQCEKLSPNKQVPLVLPLDMLDSNAHASATAAVLSHFSTIDVLVLNAGRSQRGTGLQTSVDVTRAMFELNVLSQISLAKTVLPHMVEKKSGHLVITSSVAGRVAAALNTSYACTKFALNAYFDALRGEISQHNIDVTVLCPGPVNTPIVDAAFSTEVNKAVKTGLEDASLKQNVSDCVSSMTTAMSNRLMESWISIQPILLMLYLYQYCPVIGKPLLNIFGTKRVAAFETGKDTMSVRGVLFGKKEK